MAFKRHALEREYANYNEELDHGHQYWNDLSTRSDWNDEARPPHIDGVPDDVAESEPDMAAYSRTISAEWQRPVLSDDCIAMDSRTDELVFVLNHIDYNVSDNVTKRRLDEGNVPVLPNVEPLVYETVPSFRMFGIDQNGADVLMHVHGYLPYFYADSGTLEASHGNPEYDQLCSAFCARTKDRLDDLVHRDIDQRNVTADRRYVHSVCVEEKMVAYGYQEKEKPLLKVTMLSPRFIVCARDAYERGAFRTPWLGWGIHTYESNIDYVVRFLSQIGATGHGWFRIAAGDYSLRSCMKRPDRLMVSAERPRQRPDASAMPEEWAAVTNGVPRTSYCHTEGDVHFLDLEVLDHRTSPWDKHGQYVMSSYDIEVLNSTSEFPDPNNPGDRICSIASYVTRFGDARVDNPVHMVRVFGLGSSESIEPLDAEELAKGAGDSAIREPAPIVYSFGKNVDDDAAERALILNYARFVRSIRPDMITGWNIDRFDGNYLYRRAEYLGIEHALNFSRIIDEQARIRKLTFKNNAAGKTEFSILTASGIVDFDAFNIAKKDIYLSVRRYNLNTVSKKLLKETKKDMPYEMISPTYYSGPAGRKKVHHYCGQDCRLVWKNIVAAGWHYSYIEQARATGVPLQYMCFRGVQIRVLSKQLQIMYPMNMIIPYIRDDVNRAFFRTAKYSKTSIKRKHGFVWDDRDESVGKKRKASKKQRTKGYSGATVIEPECGWHEDPVGILDFASLYPNEMCEKNLCYSTVLLDAAMRRRMRQGYDYRVTASGAAFVLTHVRKGAIPIILEEILTLRSAAKKMQRRYTKGKDPEWAIYEGRQMGLKVTANSVYGSLGTLLGTLVNLDVAEAVTSSGRRDLFKTCDLIEVIFANRERFGYEREYLKDATGKFVRDEKYQKIRKMVDDGKGGKTWPFVLDANGEKILKISCDALVVIYGDTDSVFVKLVGVKDKHEGFRIGKNVESICNAYFRPPMELEFENLMDGILLLKKKRYCGYATPSPDKEFELYVKGLEYKRRDNAEFVTGLWKETLKIILQDKRPRDALDHVCAFIRTLMAGRVDRQQFVITQALTQNIEEYAGKSAHVSVAAKMTQRDPNNAPTCGDRVEYVVCKGPKGAKICDKAEEPAYANDPANGLEIDYHYYAMKQVVKPFLRLFRPVMEFDMIRRNSLVDDIATHKGPSSGVAEGKVNVISMMMNSSGRLSMNTEAEALEYLFGDALRTRTTDSVQVVLEKNAKRKRTMAAMFGNAVANSSAGSHKQPRLGARTNGNHHWGEDGKHEGKRRPTLEAGNPKRKKKRGRRIKLPALVGVGANDTSYPDRMRQLWSDLLE